MTNIIIYCASQIVHSNSAGASRVMKYAKIFSDLGYKVYFSHLGTSKISMNEILELDSNILEIKTPVRKRRQFLFYNFFNSFIYLFRLLDFERKIPGKTLFFLYPSTDPTLELPSVMLLKGLYRKKVICEINELRRTIVMNFVPHKEKYKNAVIYISNAIRYTYYRFNEILSRFFDGLVVISKNLENYYSKYNKNTMRIPILADPVNFDNVKKEKVFINGQFFQMSFTGQVDVRKEGIDQVLIALSLLKEQYPNFRLNLYGPISGNDKRILMKLSEELDLADNIKFHGVVAQNDIPEILKKSHLLILLRPNNPQNHYGFSTKLAEYMASGTPVLATNVSDNGLYLNDGINGFILNELDAGEIAAKILWIINNYQEIGHRISLNELSTANKDFNYNNYTILMNDFILKL